MPTNQLQERLDSMLDWLVEERFLRRLGVDETYEARRQDKAIDEDETWDDEFLCGSMLPKNLVALPFERSDRSNLLRHPMARLPWVRFSHVPQQCRRLE